MLYTEKFLFLDLTKLTLGQLAELVRKASKRGEKIKIKNNILQKDQRHTPLCIIKSLRKFYAFYVSFSSSSPFFFSLCEGNCINLQSLANTSKRILCKKHVLFRFFISGRNEMDSQMK